MVREINGDSLPSLRVQEKVQISWGLVYEIDNNNHTVVINFGWVSNRKPKLYRLVESILKAVELGDSH